jgi:hypothetical protein
LWGTADIKQALDRMLSWHVGAPAKMRADPAPSFAYPRLHEDAPVAADSRASPRNTATEQGAGTLARPTDNQHFMLEYLMSKDAMEELGQALQDHFSPAPWGLCKDPVPMSLELLDKLVTYLIGKGMHVSALEQVVQFASTILSRGGDVSALATPHPPNVIKKTAKRGRPKKQVPKTGRVSEPVNLTGSKDVIGDANGDMLRLQRLLVRALLAQPDVMDRVQAHHLCASLLPSVVDEHVQRCMFVSLLLPSACDAPKSLDVLDGGLDALHCILAGHEAGPDGAPAWDPDAVGVRLRALDQFLRLVPLKSMELPQDVLQAIREGIAMSLPDDELRLLVSGLLSDNAPLVPSQ